MNQIVDKDGNPFKKPDQKGKYKKYLYSKIAKFTAVIAGLAAILSNLGTIKEGILEILSKDEVIFVVNYSEVWNDDRYPEDLIESDLNIDYQFKEKDSIRIWFDSGYHKNKRNGKLINGMELENSFIFPSVAIDVKVINETSDQIVIHQVNVLVSESVGNNEPLFLPINSISVKEGHIFFSNEGWSSTSKIQCHANFLDLNEGTTKVLMPLEQTHNSPSAVEFSVLPLLKELRGIDIQYYLTNLNEPDSILETSEMKSRWWISFNQLKNSLSSSITYQDKKFHQEYQYNSDLIYNERLFAWLQGTLSYEFMEKGTLYKDEIKFKTRVGLTPRTGLGSGGIVAVDSTDVLLKTDGIDYDITKVINVVVDPKKTERFKTFVRADKSSEHTFIIEIICNKDQKYRSKPINFKYFNTSSSIILREYFESMKNDS